MDQFFFDYNMVTAATNEPMPTQCSVKSISRKKSGSSHYEMSVSSKGYNNITTHYPFFGPLSVKWSLTGG